MSPLLAYNLCLSEACSVRIQLKGKGRESGVGRGMLAFLSPAYEVGASFNQWLAEHLRFNSACIVCQRKGGDQIAIYHLTYQFERHKIMIY
jgi:hypothetical protein